MMRIILKAETKNLNIRIPDNYVGKELEIIIFATDEPGEPTIKQDTHKPDDRWDDLDKEDGD